MHMVHIEDKYIDATGVYDIASAKEDPMGLAVMGFFFEVDNKKPQVNWRMVSKVL